MASYFARVASVEVGVEAAEEFVIVAPVAVRSRCVVDATGVGRVLGGVAAAVRDGAAVVVAAVRGGAVVFGVGFDVAMRGGTPVVVTGAADVVTGCGFAAAGSEDAAGPA